MDISTVVSLAAGAAAFAFGSSATVASLADEEPISGPRAFLACRDRPRGAVLACIGDSLTRGNMSADWVQLLREQLSANGLQVTVVNAGINMHCARNVCTRLAMILECRPTHAVVLIGTNDLKGELSAVEGVAYQALDNLPAPPTLQAYEQDLIEIRERLLVAGVQVALVSPPILGEDIVSRPNKRAADYAAVVRRVADSGGSRCTYIPLYEMTVTAAPAAAGVPYDGVRFFAWMWTMCADVYLRRKSFDEVQRERQLAVTVDLVHLGPRAARDLAAVVSRWVVMALMSPGGQQAPSTQF